MSGPPYPPAPAPPPLAPPPACSFIGSITNGVLTVTSVITGSITVGQVISDDTGLVQLGTQVTGFGTGKGGTGTYVVSPAQTISSESMITSPLFDIWQTILSQYANSPIITQLIQNFFQYLDPAVNLNAFYQNIWNINTAQGYGLDVWGRIVGVSRVLAVALGTNLGLTGPGGNKSGDSFNVAPFYNGTALTSNVALDDTSFRRLILAKALSNISNGSIPSINQLLLNLFPGRGNCYVADNRNMTLTYVFTFPLTPVEQAIVEQSGVVPKPAGVLAIFTISNLLGIPFAQYDWPVPRGYQHITANKTWINMLNRYAGQDRFFGAAGEPPSPPDQPNPRGYAFPSLLRTFLRSVGIPQGGAGNPPGGGLG